MRFLIFIALSLTAVVILRLIPYGVTENGVTYYYDRMLPNYLPFATVCVVIMAIAFILKTSILRKKLKGRLIIRQRNKDISQQLTIISAFAIVTLVATATGFLDIEYHYFLTILGAALIYQLLSKWYIIQTKPQRLSIHDQTIIEKSFLKRKQLYLENLKGITYDWQKSWIRLQFQDGLDDITLFSSEFQHDELEILVKDIIDTKGINLRVKENLFTFIHANEQS